MILSGQAILSRLKDEEVFKKESWDPSQIKEASYVLRIADDGLLVDGKFYDPTNSFGESYITIDPGKIAILSTLERLDMPPDLVGKIGIRLKYALQGLTGLMGIQVDPLYGNGKEDERLYIRVANLGNEPIRLSPGDGLFTFELHQVTGCVTGQKRGDSWKRIKLDLQNQKEPSWTYVTRVEDNQKDQANRLEEKLKSETENLREHLQPLIMFGIFLVAVTILGAALSIILSLRNTPEASVPSWVTGWGWIVLLFTLSFAGAATAFMGASASALFILQIKKRGVM